MDQKDLEYLREMAEESKIRDFSREDLQTISSALHTNVNADDTTEALDLTAQIIYEQSQETDRLGNERNVDREKLHDLTKEVLYYGDNLGAEQAVQKVDDFDFAREVEKENVSNRNVNREDSFGRSFLGASLQASASPRTIRNILDEGGKLSKDESFEYILSELIERVTSDYHGQLEEFGEKSVKNNLENIGVLFDKGLIKGQEKLNMLLSNPELFEKYPDTMKDLFGDDKELQEKLKDIKQRKESKEINEQKRDYLKDKLDAVKQAVRTKRKYKLGATGNSHTGEINDIHRGVADAQKNAAKGIMEKRKAESRSI